MKACPNKGFTEGDLHTNFYPISRTNNIIANCSIHRR